MVTSEQVAQLAGVSRATVSRVLNGSPRISAEARERVHAAIATLGYEPDRVAQSLVRHRSHTIALALPNDQEREPGLNLSSIGKTSHYFYLDMLQYIEREVLSQGYDLLFPSRPHGTSPENYTRSLQMRRVAGTILLGQRFHPPDPRIQSLLQANIPTVFIDNLGQGNRATSVKADHVDSARQITEHLLSLGHRRIAILTGPIIDLPAMERLLGCQHALARAGITPEPGLIRPGGWNIDEAYATANVLLDERRDFTAIVAGSDLMAFGILHALHEHGLRVPEDISLTGFDDVELSQYSNPSLTTIRQDREAIGRGAVQRLIAMIEGKEEEPPPPLVVSTQLVVRKSTGPSSGKNL